MNSTLIIFLLVYIAMGYGRLPGFRVDRTGAALVGALAMLAIGSISPEAAWASINYGTIGLLFGLMVVSGTFVVSGFYAWVAHKIATLQVSPPKLLAILIVIAGALSAVLTNDVVVVAMTPLLVSLTLARGLNPIPFLLAFCFAANTGSAGTLIGSPQNMIAAQQLGLSFSGLLKVAGLPALLSLVLVWAVVAWTYRKRWLLSEVQQIQFKQKKSVVVPDLNKKETWKALIVTAAVIVAFVSNVWPQELVALSAAAVLLMSRSNSSEDVLKEVDTNLLILIIGLFIVNAAMSATGLPQTLLADLKNMGLNLNEPLSLFLSGAVLSTIVGNNPAVMLLVPYLDVAANTNMLGAALVLGTGFSSNFIVFGSLAGIIVVEQAARQGVKISFMDFAKAGVPVTMLCLLMAAAWIMML